MMKEQLREGMVVHSADGERLGKIVRCGPDGFVIEKGFVFKKDYVARYDDVAELSEDGLILSRTKDELTLEGEGSAKPIERDESLIERVEEKVGLGSKKRAAAAAPVEAPRATVAEEIRVPIKEEEISTSKELHEAGRVRVHKDVETEVTEVTVPVTREEVHVQRVPVAEGAQARTAANEPSFGETTVTVPVYEEQVEITKRPVVREEIVITKEVHQEEQTIEATTRKEKVDIEEEGETAPKRKAA